MLNDIIKIDLHIHSRASEYKENKTNVKYSTIEYLDTLFSKLQQHGINLFSITDHNRFDSTLYKKANEIIISRKFNAVNSILAGVEFDVKLEMREKSCHIITIFNAKEDNDYKKIEEEINKKQLNSKEDSYSKEDYEKLLKLIGLDVILIANQRKDIENTDGYHNSLNDATISPYEYLQIGYISALEYQKPSVQGILQNCLKDFPKRIPMITGSDCHEWIGYPKHYSSQSTLQNKYFTKIKMLSTFRGLLMAFTSPETRFDRRKIENVNFLKKIMINGNALIFDNGINAIIGENGSGKTTLIKSIIGDKAKYIKDLIKKNNIIIEDVNISVIKNIGQSEIINRFNDGKLFRKEDNQFENIDQSLFESKINGYARSLQSYINKNITIESRKNNLKNHSIIIDTSKEGSTYFIDVDDIPDFSNIQNKHKERREELKKVYDILELEKDTNYYKKNEIIEIDNILKSIYNLLKKIIFRDKNIQKDIRLRNIITSKINDYKILTNEKSNSKDKEVTEYNTLINKIKTEIISILKDENIENKLPIFPDKISGVSSKEANGFVFQKEAKYNDQCLKEEFFKSMFNQSYWNDDSINTINNINDFVKAIRGANQDNYSFKWDNNVAKFIEAFTQESSYIKEVTSSVEIGNTMGEISIVYYKFQTHNNDNWEVLIIDQPEDNISNYRISLELIKYFNDLRLSSNKQIIFVTHSPLLVVNLDVDNVIFLQNNNGKIDVKSGCIEDEENGILDLIANYMDGGKEMIEKRLNLYG